LQIIKEKREFKADGGKVERNSLIDFMIEISEEHPDFTDEDIINEASTFMLAVSKFLLLFENLFLKCNSLKNIGLKIVIIGFKIIVFLSQMIDTKIKKLSFYRFVGL
jgi:hypothetical protein